MVDLNTSTDSLKMHLKLNSLKSAKKKYKTKTTLKQPAPMHLKHVFRFQNNALERREERLHCIKIPALEIKKRVM